MISSAPRRKVVIAVRVLRALQRRLFPTEYQKMVDKWFADGGDSKLRFNYDLDEDSLVVDLGGYQGQWASDLFSRYRCNIIIFEPVSSFAEQMRHRFSKNDRILVLQYGLGGSTRKETINICANSTSVYRLSPYKEEIHIVDIADWIYREDIKKIDLVKINVEGAEYEILERLIDTKLIDIMSNIQVQFHNISKDSSYRMVNIQRRLLETHAPTYQYKFVWENWTKRSKVPDHL
jgi:FkbM family methyltransferase